MDPVGALAAGKEIVDQVQKYRAYFEPFKPGIKSLIINYRDGSARIDLAIYAPSRGRLGKKVEIPVSENFHVLGMYDSEFNRVDQAWSRSDRGWTLSARLLPDTSENFLLSMQGKVSTEGLRNFVEVTVPSSPFVTKEEDKYWLHSALKSPDALKAVYQALEVDKVNVNVKVSINRCFSTSMPYELKIALQARSELLKAIASGDRNLKAKAERRFKVSQRDTRASETDVLKAIAELISRAHLAEFVHATNPYGISEILPDENRIGPVPECVDVEAVTALNYSQKVAQGELVFLRERYKQDITRRMKRLL